MACNYERRHRICTQDSRRIMFQKEVQYFEVIGEDYRQRAELEVNEVLKKVPFDDELAKKHLNNKW